MLCNFRPCALNPSCETLTGFWRIFKVTARLEEVQPPDVVIGRVIGLLSEHTPVSTGEMREKVWYPYLWLIGYSLGNGLEYRGVFRS